MIQAKDLQFMYEDEPILRDINLEIKEGSFTAIIGANGSGKTTLAKHFNALLMPTRGNVFVDGIDTKKDETGARKKVGFVFQNFEDQIIYSTVEEDVAFGLENLGLKQKDAEKIVAGTLKSLRIGELAKKNVNTLSLGQKQLVALAGVLAMKPEYVVFDEPATMLDAKNKKNIMGLIKELNKKCRIAVIMITNVIEDLKYADYVIVLKAGRILFDDKKSRLSIKVMKEAGLHD